MAESGAAWWCGLADDEDDETAQCDGCGAYYFIDIMVELDYPDCGLLCPLCWRKEREAHPEKYDYGEG